MSEADLQQAQQDLARYRGVNPAAITHQQLDQSNATAKSDAAKLDSARQAVLGAAAQVKAQQAKIDAARASKTQAEADLRNADLQLGYTIITAPRAGRVTKRSVNLGNYVTPGQALLAIVPDQMWVTANFKETQLTLMRVGQPVELHVDAFPDHPLHGTVESLQRGTGAVFSSLPAENATGNYVKVVQRVPVKIVFDGDDWRNVARPRARACRSTPTRHGALIMAHTTTRALPRSAAGYHNPWLIAVIVSIATFMEVLDTTIANVALQHIAGSLAASQDQSTYITTSYLVSNAIILPISGWLAERDLAASAST